MNLYLLGCVLLSLSALRTHKSPVGLSTAAQMLGSLASLGTLVAFIAGFFVAPWWAPVVGVVLGPAVYVFLLSADSKQGDGSGFVIGTALAGSVLLLAGVAH